MQLKDLQIIGDIEFDSKLYKKIIIISTLDEYRLSSDSEMFVCLLDMDKIKTKGLNIYINMINIIDILMIFFKYFCIPVNHIHFMYYL